MSRYADPFLNALMFSHAITVRGELWYGTSIVDTFDIVSGSISGDRSASVRRTARLTLDPAVLDKPHMRERLTPYGSRVRLFRGIRYASGSVEEVQAFYGRIDAIELSLAGVNLTCSDLGADVVDARFLNPVRPGAGGMPTTVLACIKKLIDEVHPGIAFNTAGVVLPGGVDPTVAPATNWPQERGDALDSLCTQLSGGCEWFIDMTGVANVHPLPAVISPGTEAVWIIDSGDVGVLIDRVMTEDRQGVYNGVNVTGEPVGGDTPAVGSWIDDNPDSPTRWGGPFGKVVTYYTGQNLSPNTTEGAHALARTLGLNSVASVRAVQVTCVPNPKLGLGTIVRVYTADESIDGMYFVQSIELPLEPETAMTMTLYSAIENEPGVSSTWRYAEERIPVGATWQPTR